MYACLNKVLQEVLKGVTLPACGPSWFAKYTWNGNELRYPGLGRPADEDFINLVRAMTLAIGLQTLDFPCGSSSQ